jgi:hypothetical protein
MFFLVFGNNDPQGFLIGKGKIRLVINVRVILPEKFDIEKGHIDTAFRSIGKKLAFPGFDQAGYFGPEFDAHILGPLEPLGHPDGSLLCILCYKIDDRFYLNIGRIDFIRVGC